MKAAVLVAALTAAACTADVAPTKSPTGQKTIEALPRTGPEKVVICAADSLRDFIPATAAASSVSTRLGGPRAQPGGACAPSPPCFTNGDVVGCRSDAIGSLIRPAAVLARSRTGVGHNDAATFDDHAMSRADLAAAADDAELDRLLTEAFVEGEGPRTRSARLTRAIAEVPLAFLMSHELYHLRGNTCRAPISETLRQRVLFMMRLDAGDQLFCKGQLEAAELRADECAFAELARLPTSELSPNDAQFAAEAGAVLATWAVLRNFQSARPGGIPTTPPIGYLRGGLRALLLNSVVVPPARRGRSCGEAAKLIVTAIQAETKRCEAAKLQWGGDVPDPVLALLPPRVADAWAGKPWDERTFDCE